MELFARAKAVRLLSHHGKYLVADDEEEHVCQGRDGSSPQARWAVELAGGALLRLKSPYGRYLTATDARFLLGATGRKVIQTPPPVVGGLDSSVEWEPLCDGARVRLRSLSGSFLRANWGAPPWRNSVTHDVPRRTVSQDWVLWHIDVVDIHMQSPANAVLRRAATPSSAPPNLPKLRSPSSLSGSPYKIVGWTIYYTIVEDDDDDVDQSIEELSFDFKGTSMDELTHALQEETGLNDIIVCSRNPQNGRLISSLMLHLPPNNQAMHVVVVQASSEVGLSWCL